MQRHELKYEARKQRGKPETTAEQKLYAALIHDADSFGISHMQVLENNTVATFASKYRSIAIEIKNTVVPPKIFPKRFAVIELEETFILSAAVAVLRRQLVKQMNDILAKRMELTLAQLLKSNQDTAEEPDVTQNGNPV